MLLNTGNGIDLLNTACCCYRSLNGFTVNQWDDTCILNLFERSKLLVSGGGGIFLLSLFVPVSVSFWKQKTVKRAKSQKLVYNVVDTKQFQP